jgi:hypothetical protein
MTAPQTTGQDQASAERSAHVARGPARVIPGLGLRQTCGLACGKDPVWLKAWA